jgi:hypothetical protein
MSIGALPVDILYVEHSRVIPALLFPTSLTLSFYSDYK